MAVEHTLIGYGKYAQILMNAGPKSTSHRQKEKQDTRRSALVNENHGTPPEHSRRVAANTFWYSCATPIAATPERPVAACADR
jgi:hypothetical protein